MHLAHWPFSPAPVHIQFSLVLSNILVQCSHIQYSPIHFTHSQFSHSSASQQRPHSSPASLRRGVHRQSGGVRTLQAPLGSVDGSITGQITAGTLAGYEHNHWNPGYDVVGNSGSRPADFLPSTVSINGVQCDLQT